MDSIPQHLWQYCFSYRCFRKLTLKYYQLVLLFKKMNLKLYLKTKEKGICAKPPTSLQVLAKFMNFLKKNSTDICV